MDLSNTSSWDNYTRYNSSSNITSWIDDTQIWCAYPISGAYTQFQRILFWVVIILILFFQFHDWLTTGALAFAVTYSVTSALHATILAPQKSSLYDSDLFILQDVLQSSIFATILCLVFSPRIFGEDISIFYFFWCLLIFVARMVMQYSNFFAIYDLLISLNCDDTGYCPNPCVNMSMSTTFRSPDEKLQPIIWWPPGPDLSYFATTNDWLAQAPRMSEAGYNWLLLFWFWYFTLGPTVQCALVNADVTPRDARNAIFRRVRKKYVVRDPQHQSKGRFIYIRVLIWVRYFWLFVVACSLEIRILELLFQLVVWAVWKIRGRRVTRFHDMAVLELSESKWRYVLAKILAIMWYVWAIGSYFVCVAGAIYITAKAETSVQGWLPESENKKAVGQWSPWAALALGVTAAIISRLLSPRKEKRKTILLDDPVLENQKQHELAMMARELDASHRHLHQYLIALFIYEWADFSYWRKNSIEASVEKPSKEKEEKSKNEKKKGKKVKDAKAEADIPLPFPEQAVFGHSSARALFNVLPRTEPPVNYSYEEDEELQKFLYEEKEVKGKKRT